MPSKQADSLAVPFQDTAKAQASVSPVPGLAVGSKPAPGLKGPKGLSPRTNYSRVNAGSPPVMDMGTAQKAVPPDAMSLLPQKVAEMNTVTTPTIQSMIKAAAAGAASKLAVSMEAAHQLADPVLEAEKIASTQVIAGGYKGESVSTGYVAKLASAVEYILKESSVPEAGSETKQGPGDGPNALDVSQAESSNNEIEAGQLGEATPAGVVPMNPPQQVAPGISADPGTGMQDNTSMSHPAQPADPMGNDRSVGTKTSSIGARLKGILTKKASAGASGSSPAAAVDPRLVDYVLTMQKRAEDAINPAQISGGTVNPAEPPPGVSAAGEGVPSEPSDVNSQKSMISSNEAAINYTKRQAKADPKTDVGRVLEQPALSAAHDSTLQKALNNTEQAGAKIASVRAAAALAILEKLAEEAAGKGPDDNGGKKKKSMGGMGSYQAPPVGGVAGSSM